MSTRTAYKICERARIITYVMIAGDFLRRFRCDNVRATRSEGKTLGYRVLEVNVVKIECTSDG
ncbi:hypothetical protein X777_16759 [Ooceraea biroi]|uniref:Uncharacterized protein n=1 Tax=Ooceraea biroi TaxID=2015173 RepID=A0A026VTD3_OOCBI|nr:hypothetical protein X777_16759 [Ooceraea biroi]